MKTHDRPPQAGTQPGGLLSPWCHTSFSAGWAPTAANWYVACIVAGANSACATGTLGDIDSTDRGASTFPPFSAARQRSSTVYGTSLSWLPRSLIVPLAKSHQRYHRGPGQYVAWNGRSGAG